VKVDDVVNVEAIANLMGSNRETFESAVTSKTGTELFQMKIVEDEKLIKAVDGISFEWRHVFYPRPYNKQKYFVVKL